MLQWSFPLRQIKVFAYTVSQAEYAYIHVIEHYALDFDANVCCRDLLCRSLKSCKVLLNALLACEQHRY